LSGTVVDARILFSIALKTLSSGIILSHNHSSGNIKPSYNDIKLTQKLRDAGFILDIKLLDYIIVSPTYEYFSFLVEGRLF
jgi:DNA repair protein RadC